MKGIGTAMRTDAPALSGGRKPEKGKGYLPERPVSAAWQAALPGPPTGKTAPTQSGGFIPSGKAACFFCYRPYYNENTRQLQPGYEKNR